MSFGFVQSLVFLTLVASMASGQQQFAAPGSEIGTQANGSSTGDAVGQAAVNSSQQAQATPSAPTITSSPTPASQNASVASNSSYSPEHLGSSHQNPPCFKDPSESSCREYKYSHDQAKRDLLAICDSKPFLSACSLFKLCNQGVDPASIGKSPRTCNELHLLATACKHDSVGREMQGCANYKALCGNNTAVSQCKDYAGLKYITPTAAVLQLTAMLCNTNGDEACKHCNWNATTPNCDIFSVYGEVCHAHKELNECGPWGKMCGEDASLYVCRMQLAGGRPGPPEGAGNGWRPGAEQQWVTSSAASSSIHIGFILGLCAAALAVAAIV